MNKDLYKKSDENDIKTGNYLPIVEEFYSIQGEGYHAGKPSYFIRVGGCDIACHFCDTKISWNKNFHKKISVKDIVKKVIETAAKNVVVTGGEPTMYNLELLAAEINKNSIESFLETSGAYPITGQWDWICLSPKQQKPPLPENLLLANELKVVISTEKDFQWAEKWRKHVNKNCKLFLQPEFSCFENIIDKIVEYTKENPAWNVSLQIHKFMRIP